MTTGGAGDALSIRVGIFHPCFQPISYFGELESVSRNLRPRILFPREIFYFYLFKNQFKKWRRNQLIEQKNNFGKEKNP